MQAPLCFIVLWLATISGFRHLSVGSCVARTHYAAYDKSYSFFTHGSPPMNLLLHYHYSTY